MLPLLVAVTIGLVWLLAVGAAQVRTVDAARETARALARGDDAEEAVARGDPGRPAGQHISVSRGDGEVRVVVTGEVAGPGGLFGAPARASGPRRGGRRGGVGVTGPRTSEGRPPSWPSRSSACWCWSVPRWASSARW